jgi:hypothetical protein
VALQIDDILKFNNKVVVEIGSGVGEFARICLVAKFARRHILVDIPPALAFSERYMIKEFGKDAVDIFDPNRKKVDLTNDKLVTILTPDQLGLIPKADIGINMTSFAEMSPQIVNSYIQSLKSIGITDFISINERITKGNNTYIVGQSEYIKFFGPELSLKTAKTYNKSLLLPQLLDDEPETSGRQLLHFKR